MTRKEMKQSLKNAVLTATPDVLGEILAVQNDYAVVEFKKESKPKSHISFRMASCAIAAAFMLIIGVFYMVQPTVDSIVSIDVNPGIELSVDPQDTIVKYRALNDDAVKVLDGMNLQGTDLGTAANLIIDSMIKTGYLSADSPENTILISVANDDARKAQRLQDKLTTNVDNTLKQNNAHAVILQQNETLTDDIKSFAKDNNISVGKADFVKKLANTDENLKSQELAVMSIKELASLVDVHQIDLTGVVTTDSISSVPVIDNPVSPDGEGDNIVKDPPVVSESDGNSNSSKNPDKNPNKKPNGNSNGDKNSGIPPQTIPESSTPAEEQPPESSSSAVTSDPTGAPPIGDPDQNVLIEEGDPRPYCEYCGNLLSVCEGKCDQSEGKQFCSNCGQLLSVCNGTCTEVVTPVQGTTLSEISLSKNPSSTVGAVMQKGT